MRIDAFSEGKNLDDLGANEDQFLILPGRGFAAIDGVTDRTGHRYDGALAGYVASRLVQRAVAGFLLERTDEPVDPQRLVDHVTAAIRAAYARYDILDIVSADPARRFGATLALAAPCGEMVRFVLVGDSGLRLNGQEVWINDTGLDMVVASMRLEAYRLVGAAGGNPADQARVGRAVVFNGSGQVHRDMEPWLDAASLAGLQARCLEKCGARFPAVPVADLQRLLVGGVLTGQTQFQNNTASPLSYAVLDGFDVPLSLVKVIDRPLSSIRSIELFTDGYFKLGDAPTVEAWEAAFAEVERVDPEKTGPFVSVKGRVGRLRADDRTIVIVQP